MLLLRIENLADEHNAFRIEPQAAAALSFWESECLIYWLKIERTFEREIGVKLRIVAEGFLKKT